MTTIGVIKGDIRSLDYSSYHNRALQTSKTPGARIKLTPARNSYLWDSAYAKLSHFLGRQRRHVREA